MIPDKPVRTPPHISDKMKERQDTEDNVHITEGTNVKEITIDF